MELGAILEHCREKRGVTEDLPFDDEILALRVGGKIFLLASLQSNPLRINLKCDPFKAIDLRDEFEAVTPGYHMNKVHWNTVTLDGTIPDERFLRMIDHSYDLVLGKLRSSDRNRILGMKA